MRSPTQTEICDMIVCAWEQITKEQIIKSCKICGQVEHLNVEDIVAFQDGRVASSGREQLISLLELDPKDIDYDLLKNSMRRLPGRK